MKAETKKLIEDLRAKRDKHQTLFRKIEWKIREIEDKEILPGLKKSIEGKYWKYRNNDGQNQWWIYCYCEEVKSVHEIYYSSFEVTPYQHEFRMWERQSGTHLCQTQISKREYDRELKKFLSTANKLFNQPA